MYFLNLVFFFYVYVFDLCIVQKVIILFYLLYCYIENILELYVYVFFIFYQVVYVRKDLKVDVVVDMVILIGV